EVWAECNRILMETKNGKKPMRKGVRLFAGLAFCVCGAKMRVPSNNPKYVCDRCRNKIPVADLEGIFHEQLKSFFFSPTEILKYLEQADKTIKEKQELLDTLEKEQQHLTADMDRVFHLYMNDQLSMEGFGKQHKPMEARLKQLEDEIPRLQGEIDFLKIRHLSSDQNLAEAKDLYSRWPELQQEEKRKVIENITEKVVIGKDDVTIELAYIPFSSEIMASGSRNLRDSWRRPT
ncbi:MAG: hypothetical protein PHX83_14130, partial [Acidobacteriia bacterium]|nr:hypothetical protein [Terriglobia bacterium]